MNTDKRSKDEESFRAWCKVVDPAAVWTPQEIHAARLAYTAGQRFEFSFLVAHLFGLTSRDSGVDALVREVVAQRSKHHGY